MAEMNDIVRVAIDAYRGNVQKYSQGQSMELLHQALIDANNGSTVVDYRAIRDGKCNGLFTLVEEILSRTVVEGLQGDEFFNSMVEFRNVAEGDKNVFVIEDSDLFFVAEAANGTQGIRRQRLGGRQEISMPTKTYVVKIYEEMNRVLAGRVDFNYMISKVAESFSKQLLENIQAMWNAATADDFGGTTYFPAAGTYDEESLLDVIAHVEAASGGKTATIIGTKKAVRKLAPSIQGDESISDMYNQGYYGKFYGSPVIVVPQRHKVGSVEFTMPDNVLTILASDERPIKCVYEGNPLVIMGEPTSNGDLTYEYLYSERYGLGIVTNGNTGIGRYQFT